MPARVALALHLAGRSTPSGVTWLWLSVNVSAFVCVCVWCGVVCVCVCVCVCFYFRIACDSHFQSITQVIVCVTAPFAKRAKIVSKHVYTDAAMNIVKLTWLVLGGDPAARSHRVEQLTAL